METEYEKMIAGQLYNPQDPELRKLVSRSRKFQYTFNAERDDKRRSDLVKEWLGSTGESISMKPNFVCDYGINIHLGDNFYSNWNITMLDVCPITIGKNALFGPNCQLLTPIHPLDAQERISGVEYGAPITIGDNFWAGGGVTILSGVTLGNNVVVGAGSVVTKSYGDNVVLAGNPARIIKELDRM